MSLSLEVTVNDLGFIFYIFLRTYIHLITYTPLWRPFTYIAHSLGGLFLVFFLKFPRFLPLHWVLGRAMPVRCVVLVHVVIDCRAPCWTTGQFCFLLSDMWEAHSRSCLSHYSQSTFSTSSQQNYFLKVCQILSLLHSQFFKNPPHFIKSKSYIHTTTPVLSAPYFLPPIFSPYLSCIICCFLSLATLSWRA